MAPVAFILNRSSDGGRTGDEWPRLERTLRRALGPIDVFPTLRRGHGTELCRHALAAGAELVVAVGGDGTLGEVASGFFDTDGRPHARGAFAFLQRGTGGDFQRTLAQRSDVEAFVRAVADPTAHARLIDVGRVTFAAPGGATASRHFLNIASFGIGGVFDALLNDSRKALRGRAATTLTGVRALLTYHHQLVRLRQNDGPAQTVRIHNVAIANGQYYGGGQHIAPEARLDDGLFDVVCIGDLTTSDKLAFAARIWDGEHLDLRRVEHTRARKVVAEAVGGDTPEERAPVLLDVDGEQPGALPATFEVVPRALRLVVPSAA